jgi:hypothetical protein
MSTIVGTDIFLIARGTVNYNVTATDVAAFTGGGGGSGTVTSVNLSGGTTGFTTSGGPITASGTITLAGTLNVANGGTGATTAAGAQVNLLPAQAGNAGYFLQTDGAGILSWAPASGGGGISGVSGTLPIVVANGTTSPVISINAATTTATGSVQLATAAEAAAGTDALKALTPATGVPKYDATMTGAALIPTGSDAQRPGTPVIGMVRFNTDTSFDPSGRLEVRTEDSVWRQLAYLEIPTVPPPDLTFSSSANVGGVYYCNNLLVSAGVTLTVNSGITVVFVCTGNAVINGNILANAQVGTVTAQFNGGGSTPGGSLFVNFIPGIGYGTDGATYSSLVTAAGSSPGLGRTNAGYGASTFSSVGGAGGGGILIRASGSITQAATSTLSANGGNATPGSISASTSFESLSGGGGGSGGIISLRGDLGLSVSGNILVKGGDGAYGVNTNPAGVACAGGGGGGGWVILQTGGTLTNSATITLTGGLGGSGSGPGPSLYRGMNGGGYAGLGGLGGQSVASPGGGNGASGAIINTGSPI